MNGALIFPLIALFFGQILFNMIHVWGTQVTGIKEIILFNLKITPFQVLACTVFVIGLSYGYSSLAEGRWWVLILCYSVTGFIAQMLVGFLMLGQVPSQGEMLGLILVLIGSLIAKFWR